MEEELQRYFAIEARELVDGLTQAALQVERSGVLAPEQRRHLLRLAHTLKGAARVVRQSSIADTAHAVEDLVAAAAEQLEPSFGSRLLALLDRIAASLPPDGTTPPAAAPPAIVPPADDPGRAVRVDLGAIDAALERIAEIGERCGGVRRDLTSTAADSARIRHRVLSALDLLCDDIARLRGELHEMRLAPASTVFVPLERAVRDAAVASGVRARFEGTGGEHRLEADVLTPVRDALIQLVRNAVAHGIEPGSARAAAGKPAEGVVTLAVERRGADVAWTLSDDGRGLDLSALRQAAIRSGPAANASGELSEADIVERLLDGGLSSRQAVSQISGRGVGLELVRTVVSRLGGRVSIRNSPGKGLSVELLLPVSMRSLSYLRLESERGAALLPLDAVRRASRVEPGALVEVDGRPHLLVDGHPIPLVGLNAILGGGHDPRASHERFAAIVSAAGGSVAVAAERFGETATTIARALPPLSVAAPSIRAIALDDDGRIVPVLEPAMLRSTPRPSPAAARQTRVPRVLVVDDSITTRMLEQSILESAGFDVEMAASGEEALSRAAAVQYDLFIVDVEMPLMNGFEFVAAARADPALAAIPCMLVTSRSSPDDRRRGLNAGARAYVVKGEFDQEVFLATVRGLVG